MWTLAIVISLMIIAVLAISFLRKKCPKCGNRSLKQTKIFVGEPKQQSDQWYERRMGGPDKSAPYI